MQFSEPLQQGQLIKRYKRFLADVQLPQQQLTVHCPNTGSMKNCAEPGFTVYFSDSKNDKRKYRHTWELAKNKENQWIGINTHRANELVVEAIESGVIDQWQAVKTLKRERKYGAENSRIDIWLEDDSGQHFIEVKSVTLCEQQGMGYFPDAVSARGQKHLRELMQIVAQGHGGYLIFCVQHSGIESVQPAAHIDKEYADLLKQAAEQGVKVLAYKAAFSEQGIELEQPVPVNL